MSTFGLHSGSTTPDVVRVLDQVNEENALLTSRVAELEAKLSVKKGDRKDWTEQKSFLKLDKFVGSAKAFPDWEFALHQFIRPFKFAERWINWLKDQDLEITNFGASEKAKEVNVQYPDKDLEDYDEQLYGLLSLLCTDTPLQTVKNQKEYHGIRGALAWWKMTTTTPSSSHTRTGSSGWKTASRCARS